MKASTITRWWGLINLDGGRHSWRGATDDTTTNQRQERWRRSDVGRGCSGSDGGGKGEGVVAAALAATAATTTTVIGAGGDGDRRQPRCLLLRTRTTLGRCDRGRPPDRDARRQRARGWTGGGEVEGVGSGIGSTAADNERGDDAGGGGAAPSPLFSPWGGDR